jgi:general secretion pathway protein A
MYESFYKFSAKPFRLSPDPRFFFSSQSHKRAMSYLLYGVRQGEGFIVVTGDVGTGKSTLVGALCTLLKNQNVVIAKVVTTQLEAEDLLRVTAAEFGLPYENLPKGALLKNIEHFLIECAQQGKRALLLVDEAQNLPPRSVEELRMLSNFQLDETPLLQSFLLGQKEFKRIIRSPAFLQLRQRVIAAYHLNPLTISEVKGYIEHRLRLVGWNNDPQFTEEAFAEIHRATDGVPRRINVFCDRLLLHSYLEKLHEIELDTVKSVQIDFQEEDSAEDGSYSEVRSVQPTGAQPVRAAKTPEEERIAGLEASLASLGQAMREELQSLRLALAKSQETNPPPEPSPKNDTRPEPPPAKLKSL